MLGYMGKLGSGGWSGVGEIGIGSEGLGLASEEMEMGSEGLSWGIGVGEIREVGVKGVGVGEGGIWVELVGGVGGNLRLKELESGGLEGFE